MSGVYSDDDEDDADDYDSFYDPHYDSLSEDGGSLSQLSNNSDSFSDNISARDRSSGFRGSGGGTEHSLFRDSQSTLTGHSAHAMT